MSRSERRDLLRRLGSRAHRSRIRGRHEIPRLHRAAGREDPEGFPGSAVAGAQTRRRPDRRPSSPAKGVAGLAAGLGKHGAGVVYVADQDDLALYSAKGYVGALDAAAKKESPDAVLLAATAMGKDMAPRFAARHGVSAIVDLMDLRVEDGRLVGSRPVYSGKARAEVDCGNATIQVATTRPNVFPARGRRTRRTRGSRRSTSARSRPARSVVKVETSESRGARRLRGRHHRFGRPRHQGAGELAADPRSPGGSRRGARRLARRRGRRLDRPPAPGRPDRQGRLADALRRLRNLRRDPAPGRHGNLQGHRGHQQGRRSPDLQGRRPTESSETSSRSSPKSPRRSGKRRQGRCQFRFQGRGPGLTCP